MSTDRDKPFKKNTSKDNSFEDHKSDLNAQEGENSRRFDSGSGIHRGSSPRKGKRKRISHNTPTSTFKSKQKNPFDKPAPKKDHIPYIEPEEGILRLNKYIANAGVCSRREADNYIQAGLITVNDKVITELGTKVMPGDIVKYKGKRLSMERKVYILLNKPKDTITTAEDPHAKKTVLDLVRRACPERVFPVGRLDRNTTGVLLLTNDGELTKNLTHPRFNKKKIYHVFLDKNVTKADMETITNGLTLEDGYIKADAISYVQTDDKKQVGIEIHSGKNRIIRRIFDALGYKVVKLDRVYFAGLTKKGVPRGKWRFLNEKEIRMLKMNSFE